MELSKYKTVTYGKTHCNLMVQRYIFNSSGNEFKHRIKGT